MALEAPSNSTILILKQESGREIQHLAVAELPVWITWRPEDPGEKNIHVPQWAIRAAAGLALPTAFHSTTDIEVHGGK